MSPRIPTRARHWLALLAAVAALGSLNACVGAPTTTITFLATGTPDKTGVIVHIDMIFTAGTTQEGAQYPADFVETVPFSRHQVAQVGTVASYSFKVIPTEPGQIVECFTIFNGNAAAPVDHAKAKFPKAAVCSGPPV